MPEETYEEILGGKGGSLTIRSGRSPGNARQRRLALRKKEREFMKGLQKGGSIVWIGIQYSHNADISNLGILVVKCPTTGASATYDNDTLPTHDVPCPCGNPNHWFVKYERGTT